MGIFVRCLSCKSDYKLGVAKCPKCDISLATNKRYKVAVMTTEGRRIVRLVDTYALAKKVESSLKGKVVEKRVLGVEIAPLLRKAWDKYEPWAKEHKKSWRDDLSRWEKHIKPNIGGKRMDEVYPKDVQKILNKMRASETPRGGDYTSQTIKHVLVLIKRLYNWAHQLQLYSGPNPAATIKPPKVHNEKTECLTREEMQRLLGLLEIWPNRRGALVVKFALFTGLRQSEILQLTWDRVDLEQGFINLPDPKGKPTTLPLGTEAQDIIQDANANLPTDECPYVFPNREGQMRVSFNKIWRHIRKAAGLPTDFRFHGLRHTFASYLASSGKVDLYTLQKLLNHQSPQMTQRYAHLLDETLRRGANAAGDIFSNGGRTV